MYVEIGTEAAQFPEKKYINGTFLTVKVAVLAMGTTAYSKIFYCFLLFVRYQT
jgi:hypothetical protein